MKLRLINKEALAPHVYTFTFKNSAVTWVAGQSIRLEVPYGYGSEERRFTICSAPYEGQIAITTRISDSNFKKALAALEIGQEVDSYSIEGDFTWENTDKVVFIAAGIGITPYISMLRQRKFEGKPLNATLLYAPAKADDPPLFSEFLDLLAQTHPEFIVEYFMDKRITGAGVLRAVEDIHTVYISGSNAMVQDLQTRLKKVKPELDIKIDIFTGNI